MYPVLLRLGGFRLDTYDLLWLVALSLAILWAVRRFPLYGVEDGEARRVIGWAFLAMLLGARAFEYLWNIRAYLRDPALFLDLGQGGLSEVGAVAGAFLAALLLCRRNPKVPFQALCDVAAPPAMLAIALGRWGCFFNGCCVGVVSSFPLALHFPRDGAGVARHPTQLYYSALALLILGLLLFIERRLLARPARGSHQAVVAPLALILYGAMRFAVDPLRERGLAAGFALSHWVLLLALPLELAWLLLSLRRMRASAEGETP